MTEEQIRHYLEENGYPAHVAKGGKAGLIQRWNQFVSEVERGYEFGIEDYRNDLDVRAIIRLIGADDEVREADERFKGLLTQTDSRVWESAEGDPWWDFGYPRNASADLKRDLKDEGLLPEV